MSTYKPEHLRTWARPDSYAGAQWDGWYAAPVGQHRDSDTLTRSNWAEQWAALGPFADGPEVESPAYDEDTCAPVRIVREGHWAVGWVEWAAIHSSAEDALKAADKLAERLESYPVLNEEAFSMLELEEAEAYWERMSVRERVDAIIRSRSDVSIFAARRSEMPMDDNGALQAYLNAP